MSEQSQPSSLGRGLAALFGEQNEDYPAGEQAPASQDVAIERLHPNRQQPRRHFGEEALAELAESIAANGVLQPILVRNHPQHSGQYEIVAGERRWRAAQQAQLHQVPVVVREIDDGQALELALVENLQREDLSPLEEAEAYNHLIEAFGYTQESLAQRVGKSRAHITNTLRLRKLPEPIKLLVNDGSLSAGHARALLGAEDPQAAAKAVVDGGLSVRQAERLVQDAKPAGNRGGRAAAKSKAKPPKDPDTVALERDLSDMLGLRVSIDLQDGGGSLTIHYKTLEQLDDVLRRLNQNPDQAIP